MEKTYMDSGLSTEQIVGLVKDTIYEMASRLDLKDIVRCVKAKHPEIAEEQWGIIAYDNDDIPDIRDREVLDGLMKDMNFYDILSNAYSVEEDDSGDEPEKLEE